MKAKYVFSALILFSCVFVLILAKKNKVKTEYAFVERTGAVTNSSEWINTKSAIEKLLGDLRKNPDNNKTKIQLAMAYIQESRVTGNHSFYDGAALSLLDEILSENPDDIEALCAKGTVLLSQHHFDEALAIGKKIIILNDYSAYGYGILTDAYLESGNYPKAIESADKMVSIRPDVRSYSRVSYLREIFGDTDGAIEAMELAVQSGIPGAEQTEWARVYKGHLHEMKGDLKTASMLYEEALIHRPHFAYAQAGMGRIEKYKKNYEEALIYFTNAKNNLNDFYFTEEIAGVYMAMFKNKDAYDQYKKAIIFLSYSEDNESESNHGHYSDMELALLYLKTYQYDLAFKHALIEYNRRPDNIETQQTLAWVHYRRGEYNKANVLIDKAMRTNSKHPVLLFRAGLIKAKAGKNEVAKNLIHESLSRNPHLTADILWEAKSILGDNNPIALH